MRFWHAMVQPTPVAPPQPRRPRIAMRRGKLCVIPRAMQDMTLDEVVLWEKALNYVYRKRGLVGQCVPSTDLMEDV